MQQGKQERVAQLRAVRRALSYSLGSALALLLPYQVAAAQSTPSRMSEPFGTVSGQVVSTRSGRPVAGIEVKLPDTGQKTVTDSTGHYMFSHVAAGDHVVVAVKPNGAEIDLNATVRSGGTANVDIRSDFAASAADEIVVTAQRTPNSLARKVQQEAPNLVNVQTYTEIRKLPDITVAEAVRRVPGISLETDEGEGRYVNIRGLDADLNSTTFGGLRLPPTNNASPFGGYRAVTLDSIPIGLVGAITVTKSNTPSMDAEALGGTIEITPKTAPATGRPFIEGHVGGGFEPLRSTPLVDAAVTAGTHFGGKGNFFSDGPFSIVVSASYNEDKRGIDDIEPAYFDDSSHPYYAFNGMVQRDYELNRKRHAFGIALGFDPDPNNSLYIRAFDAGYNERYIRPYTTITPDGNTTTLPNGQLQDTLAAPGAITKNLRDERESSRDRVVMIGGRNTFGGNGENTIDYRFGFTEGDYKKAYDYNSSFTLDPAAAANAIITYSPTGPGGLPNYSITGVDFTNPALYSLTSFSNSTAYNFDDEFSFVLNYTRLIDLFGAQNGTFKMGGSARIRKKQTNAPSFSYPNLPAVGPSLTAYASSGNETFYNGQYQNGVDILPGALQSTFGPGVTTANDVLAAQQQYLNAYEDVYAGYAQYEADFGKLHALVGVRMEKTHDRSNAFATQTDTFGNTTVTPVSGRADYTNWFPSAQFKYEIIPDLQARFAYSTSLARPGFNQSIPAIAVDLGANTITQGNPALKPATANNFDFTIEKYLGDSGIISIGFFDKQFSNYIVPRTVPYSSLPPIAGFNFNGGALKSLTFVNAPSAYARGIEVNFDHRFRKLPGLLSGLGVAANFTYVDSRFEIRPGEFTSLPSTSKYTWNAAIFYEKGPINLRLGVYSVSADLFAIGGGKSSDVYNDKRTSLDFGGSYAVNRHWTAYFAAKNLTDTPHTFYQGTPDRPIQREFYGPTYTAGIRFNY